MKDKIGYVFVFGGYEEPVRITICGKIAKSYIDCQLRNVDITYEIRFEDEESEKEFTFFLDKNGNWNNHQEGRNDSPALMKITHEYLDQKGKGKRDINSLAGQALTALDDCIARMGKSLNGIIVMKKAEGCVTANPVHAMRAEDYDPEDDEDGDSFMACFENKAEAIEYQKDVMKHHPAYSYDYKMAKLALERLESLD